jgi:hypothetical protein
MALTLTTAARNAAVDAVTALINVSAPGKFKIRASTTDLAILILSSTSFGASSSGTATGTSLPKTVAAVATGTADNFLITDGANTTVLSGTVTATGGGGDATLNNTSIAAGQTVNLTTLTYTQPAS